MKFFQRALSTLLAVVMAIPSTGIMNLASAQDVDTPQQEYTVTLDEVSNGYLSFAGSSEKSLTVTPGDEVKVSIDPVYGYEVDVFKILDASTEQALAEKETTDTRFSFTMPEANLVVTASFKEALPDKETVDVSMPEAAANDTTSYIALKLDNGAVKDTVEQSEETLKDVNEDSVVVLEDSDASGLAPTYHNILVNYALVNPNADINNIKTVDFITSISNTQQVYTLDGNNDCYVAFIDIGKMNGVAEGAKVSFISKDGADYNDVVTYDSETGIAYLPKSLFFDEAGNEVTVNIEADVTAKYNTNGNNMSGVKVTVENNNSSVDVVSESSTIVVPTFDITTTIPLVTEETANALDMSKVTLYINDSATPAVFDASEYFYNTTTGELTISGSPMTIYSIRIVIDAGSTVERVIKAVTTTANADTGTHCSSIADIRLAPDVALLRNFTELQGQINDIYQFPNSNVSYNTWNNMSSTNKAIVEKYFGYCHYVYSNYEGSAWAYETIKNGGAQLSEFTTEDGFGFKHNNDLETSAKELFDFLVTIPEINKTLPLHSVLVSQNLVEGVGQDVTAEDLKKNLSSTVTMRILHVGTDEDPSSHVVTKYAIVGLALSYADNTPAAYGIYKLEVLSPVGSVTINKHSSTPNITNGNDSYSLEGTTFTVFRGNTVMGTLTTDANGKVVKVVDRDGNELKSSFLELEVIQNNPNEKYTVMETTPPAAGYKGTTITKEFHITQGKMTVVDFDNDPFETAQGLELYKFDKLTGYTQGDATLANAIYEVLYYDGIYNSFTSLPSRPERKWTLKTMLKWNQIADGWVGYAKLAPEYLASGSDELYRNNAGQVTQPLGTYVIREKTPSEGYTLRGSMYFNRRNFGDQDGTREMETRNLKEGVIEIVRIDNFDNGTTKVETAWQNGLHGVLLQDYCVKTKEEVIRGGFKYQKFDFDDETKNPQGDNNDMSATYAVYNLSTTAGTDGAIAGYVAVKNYSRIISINKTNYREQIIGEDGSAYYVYPSIKGQDHTIHNLMFTFTTNRDGTFTSPNDILPYGTYAIRELVPPKGYRLGDQIEVQFSIREEGVIVETDKIRNPVNRGGIDFVKYDADDQTSTDQGDANLEAEYTVTNKSAHYVWIPDIDGIDILEENRTANTNGDDVRHSDGLVWYRFAPNARMFTFRTKQIGNNVAAFKSQDILLPVGTYLIEETWSDPSYLLATNIRRGTYRATFKITEDREMYNFDEHDQTFYNPVVRGGFVMQKNDADRKDFNTTSRVPQGDAAFKDATYEVINNSVAYVWIPSDSSIQVLTENSTRSRDIDGVMWYRFERGAHMFRFKVDANGDYRSTNITLPYGSYIIQEVIPSEGYRIATNRNISGSNGVIEQRFSIRTEGEMYDLTFHEGDYDQTFFEEVIRGGVKIHKNDADVYDTLSRTPQGDASFQGAVYDIYNISKSYVWVDTNDNDVLEDNEYYAPITINTKNETKITHDMVNAFTPCYTITTNSDGYAETKADTLPYGTYLIVERTPSEGYLNSIDRDGIVAHTFTVREEGVFTDLTYDENDDPMTENFFEPIIRGGLDFTKRDQETLNNVPLGGANLEGTFTVTNSSKSYVWIKDEEGIELSDNYTYYDEETGYYCYPKNVVMFTFVTDKHNGSFKTSDILLPYGTYTIKEILPPEGYLLYSESMKNGAKDNSVVFSIREEKVYETPSIYNYVMRGDLFFEKKDAQSGKKMAYIPFLITSLDQDGNPIESHIAYTDKNGTFYTSNQYVYHEYETNRMDETFEDIEALREVIFNSENKTEPWIDYNDDVVREYVSNMPYYRMNAIKAFMDEANGLCTGTWFGVDTVVNDDLRLTDTGALPFGTYRIDEIPCEGNERKDLVHDYFKIENEISRTSKEINPRRWQYGPMAGNVNIGTIYNWDVATAPTLVTEAVVEHTGGHYTQPGGNMVIIDKVQYEGLFKDMDYTLVALAVDAETGEKLHDATGDLATTSYNFHAVDSDGTIEMSIDVDTSAMAGRTIVIYETLYDENGYVFADHSNPEDTLQQIHFPVLGTSVIDASTNEQVGLAGPNTRLVDTVSFSNLEVNSTYTVKSYIVDAETGKIVVAGDGNEVVTSTPFKPTVPDGSFDITFNFDSTPLAGKKVVVFEEIYRNNVLVSAHNDIKDLSQTIWFPGVETDIVDVITTTQMSFAEGEAIVVDNVRYTALKPNLEYTIHGELVDMADETVFAVVEETFTPIKENGDRRVEFTVDATDLEGHTLVAYQTIAYNGISVGDHSELNDPREMVHLPKITTSAIDTENNSHMSRADDNVVITDTVTYENLIPGMEYVVNGYLVDEETGEPVIVNDELVGGESYFTPGEPNGTVDVTFEFDGTELAGRTVVVFESLNVIAGDETPIVAVHEDPSDEMQTIHIPSIHTSAIDGFNKTQISKAGNDVIIVDTVTYTNLIPGETYKVNGALVDKATRDIIAVSTQEFVANTPDGKIDVTFTANTKEYEGSILVATQDITYNNFSVARASDLDDEDETIYVPKITTEALDARNGTHVANADVEARIRDTINYTNLIPGKEYVIYGKVVDAETGEPLSAHIIDQEEADIYGDEITETWTCEQCGKIYGTKEEVLAHFDQSNGCSTYIYKIERNIIGHVDEISHYGEISAIARFTPTSANGSIALDFIFDARELENKTVVFYEELFMTNSDESVFTEIYTCQGCGSVFGTKQEVLDHFANSRICSTYTLTFNTNMISIAEHKDLNDANQTVHFPMLTKPGAETANRRLPLFGLITSRAFAKDESRIEIPNADRHLEANTNATVVDHVTVKNLVPGYTYTVIGKLFDKESGSETGLEATTTFIAESSEEIVDLNFVFDSTPYAGKVLVACEKAYVENSGLHEVADYSDMRDKEKAFNVVRISTTIADQETATNVASDGKTTIIDTVDYEGLIPGKDYVISGILVDPETGEQYQAKVEIVDRTDESTGNGEITKPSDEPSETPSEQPSTPATEPSETPSGDAVDVTPEKIVESIVGSEETFVRDDLDEVNPEEENFLDFIKETVEDFFTKTENKVNFTPETPTGKVDVIFTLDTEGLENKTLVAYEKLMLAGKEDEVLASHEDISDPAQSIHVADLHTENIVDALTELKLTAYGKKVVINETATYSNVVAGKEYELVAFLADTSTGIPVCAEYKTTFKPMTDEETTGELNIEYNVDTTVLEGKTLVSVEKLLCNGVVIATHQSNADTLGMNVASVKTTAISAETNTHTLPATDNTIIVDTVEYTNLTPGVEYTLVGALANADGNIIRLLNAEPVEMPEDDKNEDPTIIDLAKDQTIAMKFTPETANGTVEIRFAVDATTMMGQTITVVETLFYNNIAVAEHLNAYNADQSVYVPVLSGTISDKNTGIKVVANSTSATVVDDVTIGNIVVGETYTLESKLVDVATGDVVGTAANTIVAKNTEEKVNVEFPINALDLAGKTLVGFQTLKLNDITVVDVNNINDTNHMVVVPAIDTNAFDKLTRYQSLALGDKTIVVDSIKFANLLPGYTYEVNGSLIDVVTGEAVATTKAQLAPSATSGVFEVEFELDTTKAPNRTFVAVESITYNGVEVAAHEDLEDNAQKVFVAEISTNATINGKKTANVAQNTVIVDTVTYKNLVPGVEYDLVGKLVDRETGKAISANGKAISTVATFTPTSSDGTITVEFKLDSTKLTGRKVVVFEDLTLDGVTIAGHNDTGSVAQTIEFTGKQIIINTPSGNGNSNNNNGSNNGNTNNGSNNNSNNGNNNNNNNNNSSNNGNGSYNGNNSNNGTVQTGDNYTLIFVMIGAGLLVAVLAVVVLKKKRK